MHRFFLPCLNTCYKYDQNSMISSTMRTSSSADLFEQINAADFDHDQLDHEQIAEFFASIRSGSFKDL